MVIHTSFVCSVRARADCVCALDWHSQALCALCVCSSSLSGGELQGQKAGASTSRYDTPTPSSLLQSGGQSGGPPDQRVGHSVIDKAWAPKGDGATPCCPSRAAASPCRPAASSCCPAVSCCCLTLLCFAHLSTDSGSRGL